MRATGADTRSRIFLVYAAGAEFWSAFFFMSTIALPVIFYVTHVVTPKALILSLSGVLLAVTFVACTMFVQRREEADAFHAW